MCCEHKYIYVLPRCEEFRQQIRTQCVSVCDDADLVILFALGPSYESFNKNSNIFSSAELRVVSYVYCVRCLCRLGSSHLAVRMCSPRKTHEAWVSESISSTRAGHSNMGFCSPLSHRLDNIEQYNDTKCLTRFFIIKKVSHSRLGFPFCVSQEKSIWYYAYYTWDIKVYYVILLENLDHFWRSSD